jgi:hypothetical protein
MFEAVSAFHRASLAFLRLERERKIAQFMPSISVPIVGFARLWLAAGKGRF